MLKKLMICAFAVSLFQLPACNTMKGIGQDIRKSGEALSTASQETSEAMKK